LEFVNLKEIVLQLKAIKEKDNLTINEIMMRLEESGSSLSESTIRRVFKDNSENDGGFTYEKVLKPIAEVLLPEESEMSDDPALFEKNEALHAIIKEKNRVIETLQDKIEDLNSQNSVLKQQIDGFRKEYDLRLRFLRDQIELKDKRMDEKDEIIKRLMDKCL
jgi:Fe2+ or Zn2+ uptake regulation protein